MTNVLDPLRPFRQHPVRSRAVRAVILLLFVLIGAGRLHAQNVEWASEVLGFSSQKSDKEYSAAQVLGKPNKLPAPGDSPCAWLPASDPDLGNQEEWIKVGFPDPMRISQVAIGENVNPGAIEKVILYDDRDREHVIYQIHPRADGVEGKMRNVYFQKTTYTVGAVKIVLQPGLIAGPNEIDAIGIGDGYTPIKAEINLAPNVEVGKRENLGVNINSTDDEVLPVISPDGTTLFFDRKTHGQTDDKILVSTLDARGNWLPAQDIGPTLNNGRGSFVTSVTPDGNTLLIGGTYHSNGPDHFGLWLTHRTVSGWSYPEEVHVKNFYTRSKYVEFCLSNDGRTIILSLDRSDTRGGKDLYVSFLQPDGNWSEPKSLGPVVNTAAQEATPFLAADDKTLYFASDGFAGYGSQDMFITRRLDDTWQHWSEPQNLGPDLNTPNWDAYYTVPASGEYAYFVSTGGPFAVDHDIYRVKLPESLKPKPVVLVEGKVLDSKTGKPVSARIRYELLSNGRDVGDASTSPTTGVYKITLPSGEQYGYRAEAAGYIAVSENLDLKNAQKYGEIHRDLMLVPIEKGQTVRLNNIFFETGKSDLKPESFPELDRIAKLLEQNPKMEITISGHTDNVGSPASNQQLSEARAKAVMSYLTSKGIPASRLKAKGYGDTKPIAANTTEEGRQQNRRVEFTIVK